jgi:geranylgeranyl pyrophosphate synthase
VTRRPTDDVRTRTGRPQIDLDRLGHDLLGPEFVQFIRRIDSSLGDLAGGEGAPPGFDPRRFLAPGVPRVRPVLVLLSAGAARPGSSHDDLPDPAATEQTAAAAELLQVALFLHDAALGRQGGRRRRVARRIISRTVGLLSANHVTLRALELVRATPAPETVGDLLEALREVGEGQVLTQSLRGGVPSPEQVSQLAEQRNGAVFAFACRAGARLVGADRATCSALARYGRNTGIAWFIADELALLSSTTPEDQEVLMERVATGTMGLAVAIGARREPRVRSAWRALARPEGDRAELLALLHSCGALQDAQQRLVEAVFTARSALRALPDSSRKEALDTIAKNLLPEASSTGE